MEYNQRIGAIESILFISGEPVAILQLQRALGITEIEIRALLQQMEEHYREQQRGILLYLTEETAQLVSNPEYLEYLTELLQPAQTKTFSQSMLETLSIIAYRQPVTRSDIEAVRGVRCEYSVSQLLKLGMICELGRKDAVGRPMLFGTTDAFLRQFGLHSITELPCYDAYSHPALDEEEGMGETMPLLELPEEPEL